jgi:hypothetical protein
MSLSNILGPLDAQVTPTPEPLLPGNNIVYAIVGKKGSGKSTLVLSLFNSEKAFKRRFNYVWMFSPTAQGDPKYEKLVEELTNANQFFDTCTDTILSGVLDRIRLINERWKRDHAKKEIRHVLLLDDCMSDLSPSKQAMLSRIVVTSRHLHCSVIIASQKYNAIPTLIRAQLDLISCFKSYNTREVTTLQEDISIDPAAFYEIYEYCTDGPHSFMHVNLLTNPVTFYKRFDELDLDPDVLRRKSK